MKTSKIDRLVSVAVIGICLVKAILYGGSKAPTNAPPSGTTGVSPVEGSACSTGPGTTGVSPVEGSADTPSALRPMMAMSHQPTNQFANQLTNWTARGAWNDWRRIDFPDGFAFPYGTNLLTGVTLMSWGELRCNDGALAVEPHQSATTGASSLRIVSLPSPVSLEPGASSVSLGLTQSNSFVFAWQNCCIDREATNRVDAAIELFASGDMQVRFGNSVTNIPAVRPEGFIGEGQNDDWAAAAFSDDIAAITNKGYDAWLMEDCVGINQENGKYKVSVTIAELPEHGPCYLVVGPYKMVVTSPGTYSFPLEVFEHYEARTYPTAVPLTFDYDDGYRSEEPDLCLQLPPRQLLGVPLVFPPIYDIWQEPRLVISPTEIPLETAVGTHISIWCNVASAVRRYSALISREFRLNFCNPSDAEIIAAEVEDLVEIIVDAPLGTYAGTITITDLHSCCGCGSCSGDDCSCGCDCWRHRPSTDTPTNTPSTTP